MQARKAKLDYNKLKSSVLIVDIGSSTTDFTLVRAISGVTVTLWGCPDRQGHFARTLANHEQGVTQRSVEEYPSAR